MPDTISEIGLKLTTGDITMYNPLINILFITKFLLSLRDLSNNELYGTITESIHDIGKELKFGNINMYG